MSLENASCNQFVGLIEVSYMLDIFGHFTSTCGKWSEQAINIYVQEGIHACTQRGREEGVKKKDNMEIPSKLKFRI